LGPTREVRFAHASRFLKCTLVPRHVEERLLRPLLTSFIALGQQCHASRSRGVTQLPHVAHAERGMAVANVADPWECPPRVFARPASGGRFAYLAWLFGWLG